MPPYLLHSSGRGSSTTAPLLIHGLYTGLMSSTHVTHSLGARLRSFIPQIQPEVSRSDTVRDSTLMKLLTAMGTPLWIQDRTSQRGSYEQSVPCGYPGSGCVVPTFIIHPTD